MPGTTTCADLPYPTDGDGIDVAAHIQDLAEAVDTALCAIVVLPVGTIIPWWDNGSAPPTGLLRCNGATFSGVTYPALASHLGTTTLPNLEGRFLRGTGGAFPTNGQTGGFDDATLVQHDHPMPHNHAIDHNHPSFDISGGPHDHPLSPGSVTGLYGRLPASGGTDNIGFYAYTSAFGGTFRFRVQEVSVTESDASHIHTVDIPNYTGTSGAPSIPNTTAVGQAADNRNLPPFMNVTFLIKAVL